MLLMGANTALGLGSNHNHAAIIQYDFNTQKIIDAGIFTVRFDMDPMSLGCEGSLKYYGGGVFIGGKNGTASNVVTGMLGRGDSMADLAVGFTDSKHSGDNGAKTYTYNGANKVGFVGASTWTTFDSSSPSDFVEMYTFELRVELQPEGFADGTSAKATMWWGAQGTASESLVEFDLNGSLADKEVTWDWDANESNYIGFFSYTNLISDTDISNHSVFDNVEVSIPGEIPEPSTMALLATGLIGLLAYAWRKRK